MGDVTRSAHPEGRRRSTPYQCEGAGRMCNAVALRRRFALAGRPSRRRATRYGRRTSAFSPMAWCSLPFSPLVPSRSRGKAGSRHDGFPTPRNHENVSYALPFAVCPLPRTGEGGRGEGVPRRIEHTSLSPGRPARTAGRAAGRERARADVHPLPLPQPLPVPGRESRAQDTRTEGTPTPIFGADGAGGEAGRRARNSLRTCLSDPFSEERGPGG